MTDIEFFDTAHKAGLRLSGSDTGHARAWQEFAEAAWARRCAAKRAARTFPTVLVNGDRLTIDGKRYRCDTLQPQRLGFIAALLKYRELAFAGIGSTDAVRNTTRRFAKWADSIGQHGIADACKRAAFSGDIASIE